jgi:hypothetical protein
MGRFLRGRARTPPTLAHLRLRSRPAPSASSGRCQVGTSASRTHMSASLLRGRETVTHPTHHCARYCPNPSPSSATTPSVVASQILVDGPSTCHHPHATRMIACPPSTCVCSSMRCPSVKFRPHPTPRSSIQASVSYRRIPLPAASPVTAVKPHCRRGVASPYCTGRPLSRPLRRHDTGAKHPATRPRAAPLLPPSLLTPRAARLASSSLAPCRVGTVRWHAHARRVATASTLPVQLTIPTPAYGQNSHPSRALHGARCCPRCALPPRRAITSLPLSLRRPVLLLRITQL